MSVTPTEASRAFDPATQAEIERVRASGVLGSTGRLVELFDFLLARSAEGRPPKEAEIALAVFGKTDPNALRDDPVARVYVHRLRKRLDDFYLRHGAANGLRLDIPKGDYRIVAASDGERAVSREEQAAPPADPGMRATLKDPRAPRRQVMVIAAALAVLAIGANIAAWVVFASRPSDKAQIASSGLWAEIANSPRPLLIVVGDYYMFGEYEDRVKLKRLVRDFTINSKEDLVHSQRGNPAAFERYSDVAMQYLPASAAFALTDLAPLLREGRKVEVSLASELTPERLKTDDIIYVGLLSGLGPLRDPVFSQSRFAFGETYDQIVDRKTGRTYTSEAFLTAPSDNMYSDYGFFSTFEGPTGNRIAIVSGTRDAAVMGVAETLSRIGSLDRFTKKTGKDQNFESLLVVKGQKHTNLEAQVVASYDLDSRSIWAGPTANPASFPAR